MDMVQCHLNTEPVTRNHLLLTILHNILILLLHLNMRTGLDINTLWCEKLKTLDCHEGISHHPPVSDYLTFTLFAATSLISLTVLGRHFTILATTEDHEQQAVLLSCFSKSKEETTLTSEIPIWLYKNPVLIPFLNLS